MRPEEAFCAGEGELAGENKALFGYTILSGVGAEFSWAWHKVRWTQAVLGWVGLRKWKRKIGVLRHFFSMRTLPGRPPE